MWSAAGGGPARATLGTGNKFDGTLSQWRPCANVLRASLMAETMRIAEHYFQRLLRETCALKAVTVNRRYLLAAGTLTFCQTLLGCSRSELIDEWPSTPTGGGPSGTSGTAPSTSDGGTDDDSSLPIDASNEGADGPDQMVPDLPSTAACLTGGNVLWLEVIPTRGGGSRERKPIRLEHPGLDTRTTYMQNTTGPLSVLVSQEANGSSPSAHGSSQESAYQGLSKQEWSNPLSQAIFQRIW